MKLIDKKDMKFESGYLMYKDKLIANTKLVEEVNLLFKMSDLVAFVKSHAQAIESKLAPMPSYHGVQDLTDRIVITEPETPETDAQVERTMAILAEHEDLESCKQANELLAQYPELMKFLVNDKYVYNEAVVSTDKMLTDPLSIDAERVTELMVYIAEHDAEIKAVL